MKSNPGRSPAEETRAEVLRASPSEKSRGAKNGKEAMSSATALELVPARGDQGGDFSVFVLIPSSRAWNIVQIKT